MKNMDLKLVPSGLTLGVWPWRDHPLGDSVVKAGFVDQWKISIWKQSMTDLVSIVKPYIIDEIKYKLIGYI